MCKSFANILNNDPFWDMIVKFDLFHEKLRVTLD